MLHAKGLFYLLPPTSYLLLHPLVLLLELGGFVNLAQTLVSTAQVIVRFALPCSIPYLQCSV